MLKRLNELKEPEFYLDKITRDNLVIFKSPTNPTAVGIGPLLFTYTLPNDGYIYQLLHFYTRIIAVATVATRTPKFTATSQGIDIFTVQDDIGITASQNLTYSHSFMQGFGGLFAGGYSSNSLIRTIGIPLLIGQYPDSFTFGIDANGQIGDILSQIQLRLLKSKNKNAFGERR